MSISKKLMTTGATDDTYVEDVFSTYVYTGTGAEQDIVNGIDLDGEGGLIWTKCRDGVISHQLFDTERVNEDNGNVYALSCNDFVPQIQTSNIRSFNSDGFRLGEGGEVSSNGNTFASWTFRRAPKFFDCVSYTGDGQMGRAIPHILGVKPGMVVVKRVDAITNWFVWHKDVPGNGPYGYLESDGPFQLAQSSHTFDAALMTDSTFGVGTNSGVNASNGEYIAYVFAHDDSDEGLIQCGTFTEPSGGTVTVDLGFEPQFVLLKAANVTDNWRICDMMRGMPVVPDTAVLYANEASKEVNFTAGAGPWPTPTATGFEWPSGSVGANEPWVYMAIRRPNRPASELEADELFAIDTAGSTGDGKLPAFRSGFPVDMAIRMDIDEASNEIASRPASGRWMYTDQSAAESVVAPVAFDHQSGWFDSAVTASNYSSFMWRRAPGFFDVVAWTGAGQGTIRGKHHQLGAVPEMMWFKERTESPNTFWYTYHKALNASNNGSANSCLFLDQDQSVNATNIWSNTDPTATEFTIGRDYEWDSYNQTYIAYLFASLPGICDIGSYTGNGTTLDIDCGFTNGARWFMIKRTDQDGDWYFTSRPGSPEFLLKFNKTDAEMNYSSTFTVPQGFRVRSTLGDINVDGGTYIYMAIA